MQIYNAPLADIMFQLKAFGYAENVASLPAFEGFDIETVEALLDQAANVASEVMLPMNRSGDQEGLKWDPKTGSVTTPKGFQEAYRQIVDLGFVGICGPEDFGGGGAPQSLGTFITEMWVATNKAFSMCPGLTNGLVEALHAHGSEDLKARYLPKLVTGEWSGTMCLTEPQCGTDLGIIRTKAEPNGDSYLLTGTKIWITFGEHDLTDQIIHLVLARLPDAPPGIKGISCFIVPKIKEDGELNNVRCTGLEHKMGINASPTCVIDMEDSVGYLVGEPHKGMRSMFTMMNGARLLVGMEGVALSDIAYQTALAFAKDRRQSRSLDPKKRELDQPADNILVHPDVRRMLLNVKSTVEGMRGLATLVAINLDVAHNHTDEAVRNTAGDLVGLLTPVVKSYCTERGFFNVSECMQVCGGAGYTTDWSIEQYLRDVRIGMIYEGTNHIQALDLVGRKLALHGGRMFKTYVGQVMAFASEHAGNEKLGEFIAPLGECMQQLIAVTTEFGSKAMQDAEEAGAGASLYTSLFGLIAVAHSWAVQCAHAAANPGPHSDIKFKTARYYFQNVLPERHGIVAMMKAGKANMMAHSVDEL